MTDIFKHINFNPEVEKGATFAVPNEIFSDFMAIHKFGKCAYAYSYYYLTMYLHLYAKYGSEDTVDKFTFQGIQEILGIAPENRTMSAITKKGGDLDKLAYTSTVTDYPVSLMRFEREDKLMEVHHYMYSEEKKDFPDKFTHSNNFTVKHPDKMYWRTRVDKLDNHYNGTMNDPEKSHMIPLEMFLHALNIPDIGVKGFYVYGFIIYKNDVRGRGKGWTVTHELFCNDIGISRNTLFKILKQLEVHNFITIHRRTGENKTTLPNIYHPIIDPNEVKYI